MPTPESDTPDVPTAPVALTPADVKLLLLGSPDIGSRAMAEIERLRARVAEREARERVLHGQIANLTARLSACLDCLPAGMTGGPIP